MHAPLARRLRRPFIVAFAIAGLGALAPLAPAQRALAKFDWQGKEALFDCGVARVGKYTLDSLEVGKPWRLGAGPASTLTLGAPLLADDLVVPPGNYRIQLVRPGAQQFELLIEGAGRFCSPGENVNLKGKLGDAKPPSKALEIALAPEGEQPDKELRPLAFAITFGAPRVTVPLSIVGGATKKLGGATLDWFKLPTEYLAKKLKNSSHAPIAAVTLPGLPKDAPKAFNVMLGEDDVQLVGQDAAVTDAFAVLPSHVATWDKRGKVAWSDATDAVDHLVLDDAKYEKGKELKLFVRTGKRKAEITIPLASDKK